MPLARAAGIMYSCNGEMLLMKRSTAAKAAPGVWAFPAGKIEGNETPEACARREFFEETGTQISGNMQIVGQFGEFILYRCEGPKFDPVLNNEHTEFTFARAGALPTPIHANMAQQLGGMVFDSFSNPATARRIDQNGYIEIKRNPISRSGIFQYLGKSIGAPEPDRVYNVYRPAEEFMDEETIKSFKLIPFVDDHTMIGPEDEGFVPAEYKGVHGTTGDEVFFEDGVLYSNLKIFSTFFGDMLKQGKNQLSLGYRCVYEKVSGFFQGQPYDYIQRNLRGNHLALVDKARCSVAVLDHQLAFDHFDLALDMGDKMADEGTNKDTGGEGKTEPTMAEVVKMMGQIMPMVKTINDHIAKMSSTGGDPETAVDRVDPSVKPGGATGVTDSEKDDKEKDAKDGDDKDGDKDADKEKPAKDEGETKEEKKGMDAAISRLTGEVESLKKNGFKSIMGEVKARDTLAEKLSHHIGTFDHSDKTFAEVAKYGVEKLGIKCPDGHEGTALDAFLMNRSAPSQERSFGMDAGSTTGGGKLDAFLKGKKAT